MARRAFLVELDDSEAESLSGSLGQPMTKSVTEALDDSMTESLGSDSATEFLAESVGSVDTESEKARPEGSLQATTSGRRKKMKATGSTFMHFFRELRDVPVNAAWEFIRDHRIMSALAPGITDSFAYLEGCGGAGSTYAATFCPRCVRPGECKYVINKVEVCDDDSHMYAARCVGGKYTQRYNFYMTYIKVMPDIVHGNNSSIIVWRLEYELRNTTISHPFDTKQSYMTVMDLIRERHMTINRVERPLSSDEGEGSDIPWSPGQQLLTSSEDHETDSSERRRRRARVKRPKTKHDEESDRESRLNLTTSIKLRAGGSGLAYRRRPLFRVGRPTISTARTALPTQKPPCSFISAWKLRQYHLDNLRPQFTVEAVI